MLHQHILQIRTVVDIRKFTTSDIHSECWAQITKLGYIHGKIVPGVKGLTTLVKGTHRFSSCSIVGGYVWAIKRIIFLWPPFLWGYLQSEIISGRPVFDTCLLRETSSPRPKPLSFNIYFPPSVPVHSVLSVLEMFVNNFSTSGKQPWRFVITTVPEAW